MNRIQSPDKHKLHRSQADPFSDPFFRLRFHDGGATSEFDIVVDAMTSTQR
jgi:hypothetical protein